ncbi:MAG TPA: hypothetical protein VKY74_15555, partial [Chloroflexia bacterium]|nr:hypothetical protein [Chloroflexia bacterium]
GDGLAGIWAGAMFIAFPVSNLLFSDGGYPGIFATWLLVLLIAGLVWGYAQLGRPRVWLPLGGLLALALLAHTAQALLLGTTLLCFLAAVAWQDRGRVRAVAVWAGSGVALAFLAFYQFTAGQMVAAVLPQIVQKLQTAGTVGKNPAKLGAPLLSGFWPQIAAHFQAWPVGLALVALAQTVVGSRQSSVVSDESVGSRQYAVGSGDGGPVPDPRVPSPSIPNPKSAVQNPPGGPGPDSPGPPSPIQNPKSKIQNPLGLWLAASAATLALFSLVDVWINLLQKHMIYSMPALALLNGLALAGLWRRGRAGQLLCLALWAALFTASVAGWANRVVFYLLPPGSG